MKLKRFIDEKVKKQSKIKKVFGYIRVSTINQIDNTSLTMQEQKIKAFCKIKDWELVKIFKEVGSGAKESREQYNEMIQELNQDNISGIVVYHIDRLYRDSRQFAELNHKLKKTKQFISTIEGGLDSSTEAGAISLKFMVLIAEIELENIKRRFKGGRIANFKNTGKIGSGNKGCTGVLPFGYYYNEDGVLKIDRERAETVKTIFKMRIDKASLGRITKDLNENGILTQRGNKFSRYSVNSILKNVFYAGDYKYSGWIQHDHHKEIISMNDWCKVNKRTKKTEKFKSRRNSKVYKFPVIAPMIPEGLKSEQYRVFN